MVAQGLALVNIIQWGPRGLFEAGYGGAHANVRESTVNPVKNRHNPALLLKDAK